MFWYLALVLLESTSLEPTKNDLLYCAVTTMSNTRKLKCYPSTKEPSFQSWPLLAFILLSYLYWQETEKPAEREVQKDCQ